MLTSARHDRAKEIVRWILGTYNGGEATSFEYLRVGRQEGDPLEPHPQPFDKSHLAGPSVGPSRSE